MLEPWLIGLIFGLYILGAASTKDFADMKGDEEGGCITLPLRFGVETSTKIITPFFILPFLLLFVFAYLDLFSANRYFLMGQGLGMAMWGGYVAYLIVRKPSELATEANHVSWKHMYLMMVVGQIGIVAAYLLH